MADSRGGLHTITGAVVLAPVNEGDPNPGLFHALLAIFMLQERKGLEPIRVRIHQRDPEWHAAMVEKVNSLVGKPVVVVINRSPWAASDKSGVVNYLQSIEACTEYKEVQDGGSSKGNA